MAPLQRRQGRLPGGNEASIVLAVCSMDVCLLFKSVFAVSSMDVCLFICSNQFPVLGPKDKLGLAVEPRPPTTSVKWQLTRSSIANSKIGANNEKVKLP